MSLVWELHFYEFPNLYLVWCFHSCRPIIKLAPITDVQQVPQGIVLGYKTEPPTQCLDPCLQYFTLSECFGCSSCMAPHFKLHWNVWSGPLFPSVQVLQNSWQTENVVSWSQSVIYVNLLHLNLFHNWPGFVYMVSLIYSTLDKSLSTCTSDPMAPLALFVLFDFLNLHFDSTIYHSKTF